MTILPVKFLYKISDKMAMKRNFLNVINLYYWRTKGCFYSEGTGIKKPTGKVRKYVYIFKTKKADWLIEKIVLSIQEAC